MAKLFKVLKSRTVLVGLAILIQAAWYILFLRQLTSYSVFINGFFQFIIKEGVALGKLEGIEIELFHHREAQAVERGEHPAASALFLIGNLALFEADRKLMHVLARDLVVLRAGVDAVCGDRVHGDGVDRVLVEGLFKLAEIFHRNIGVHNQSLLQK